MAASNVRKKFGKVRSSGSIDMLAHRLSDTHRDMLINCSASTGGGVIKILRRGNIRSLERY